MRIQKVDVCVSLTFFAGIALALLAYWPGLVGGFIFDDFNNLSALGAGGGVTDLASLKEYILSGSAGPTGRPIALLSFLVDANDWPADPFRFKYTNLLIHALNGVLLFWLILKLLHQLEGDSVPSSSAKAAALVSSLAWLLHPYLASTTLYAVQRMAQLPLLFTLSGALVWLHGRRLVPANPKAGYLWMSGAVSVFGLLAVLSKENGALLPLSLWVVESTVVRASGLPSLNIWWRRVFFTSPAILICLFLLYAGFSNGWFGVYPGRDFSPYERVLTQSRVLFVYLYQWFVPHIMTAGLFHDGFEVSRGLFSPMSTVLATCGTIILVVGALYFRKKRPLVSLAILTFYVSQLVESTTIGLEVLFEHRMYAGSILLYLPLIYGVWRGVNAVRAISVSVILLGVLSLFCWQRASLWGNPVTMLQMWTIKAPASARARVQLATEYGSLGATNEALVTLNQAVEDLPESFHVRMSQVLLHCQLGILEEKNKMILLEIAEKTHYQPNWMGLMQNTLRQVSSDNCQGFDAEDIIAMSEAFLSRSPASDPESIGFGQLTYVKGVAQLIAGSEDLALAAFKASIDADDSPQKLMDIARYAEILGNNDAAYSYASLALEVVKSGELRVTESTNVPDVKLIQDFLKNIEVGRESAE